MSSIHVQRARRWETTPFAAEWLAKAVEFCHRTSEGKAQFEKWATKQFGAAEGRDKIKSCQKPPKKKYGPSTGNAKLWNSAGVELGVCDEAVILYHQFTAEKNLCAPERTKPAPKRRRGESASEWIARRHSSLLDGCKPANVDWDIARAIATSEMDKVRDNIQGWRADPIMFFEVIMSQSAALTPASDKSHSLITKADEAFRMCTLGLNISHLTWSYATSLFRDLAHMNVSTSSAIERAYKKDNDLLWRFASCHALALYEQHRLWWNVKLQMSVSPYFRPYFDCIHVDPHTGSGKIKIDKQYLQSHPLESLLDRLIIDAVTQEGELSHGKSSAFFDNLVKYLADKPSDTEKFSTAAYCAIGDLATTHEFIVNLYGSPFGLAMRRHAMSIKTDQDRPALAPDKCFVDPSKITMSHPIHNHLWSDAHDINTYICNAWIDIHHKSLTVRELLHHTLMSTVAGTFPPDTFDAIWEKADGILWRAAQALDRPNEPGRLAKEFGLIDPSDPNKPTFTDNLFRLFEASEAQHQQDTMTVPAPKPQPPTEAIPVATLTDSAAKSGHAFVAETQDCRPKQKAKTRGAAVSNDEYEASDDGDETEPEQFPCVLPTEFKLGRKLMKVFHRILPDGTELSGASTSKKGQLRWGDFERAMKRIGFDVVQTAGSSVRFDPPARTARPITFHRPHPDSIMTPLLIKWVGARLNRCYGWRSTMFTQSTQADD